MHKIGQISLCSYKNYCYALRELLGMSEEDHQVNRLQPLDKDSKRSWKVLNSMLGRKVNGISNFFVINGQDIHDPNIIANEFCKYFIEHPENIQNSILPPQNDYADLIPFSGCTFVFNQSSPEKVYAEIKNLMKEGSKSDISMKFIKMCGMRLATILCDFLNMC